MKKLLAFITLAAIATSVLATPEPKTPKTPTTLKCAVTKDKVNIADATKKHMFADYKGRRYFFCCAGCPEEFAKNPAKYSKAPSIATPKAPKAKAAH